MTENAESLLKDPKCQKSKEHFMSALRVLELVQIGEIEMLLDTIIGVGFRAKLFYKINDIFRICTGKRKICC